MTVSSRSTLLLAGLLLAACSPLPISPAAPALPSTMAVQPASTTMADIAMPDGQAQNGPVLRIDAPASLLTITVRRGGALARLGHDHVIASRTLEGWVAPARGQAFFQFRLDAMSVDEAALRAQAGLETTPSNEAIAGTRHNMLVRVLDAERYPLVTVQARYGATPGVLDAAITLHGVTRQVAVPTTVVSAADGRSLQASGKLLLNQSDFGITPFSVLGGAMAVQDQMELAFDIRASAPAAGAAPGR
ncbi:YceI family protein [Janthinobacterium aquaticum]|uniref:YceI family protein n=1 Tax=Janthinobacterium sp. FT58W TaxID=2654254 RepID=UPI001265A647|nr:YceI family protein [Janthinobacterium sp. FT58W]KAB8045187.1 YceI family protein [Janthinobacterium sp. FT58W]